MRKKNLLITLLAVLFLNYDIANASTCSYSERAQLNKDVASIKVIYEEQMGLVDPSLYECQPDNEECTAEYNYFKISVLNMSKDFYFTVKNNVDNTKKTYRYSDSVDGVISFNWEGILNITTFTFEVYSSEETGCPRDRYRTIYLTTPRKNLYHYYGQCQNDPDYFLCEKYVTFEEMSFYEFMDSMEERAEELKKEQEKDKEITFFQKIIDYIVENKFTLLIIGGVVVAGVATTVVVVKVRRKKSVL